MKFETVDEYIGTFPKDVQDTLEIIRQTIKKAKPEAAEVISYQLPAFEFHGMFKIPMVKPFPLELLRDLVTYRANENLEREMKKKK
jgi:uncharacterized protein YdhG (YjbR/CyaY superfamily)